MKEKKDEFIQKASPRPQSVGKETKVVGGGGDGKGGYNVGGFGYWQGKRNRGLYVWFTAPEKWG